MTLREVVQRIQASQQMAETDQAAALRENRALFLDLLRQDRAYIIPEAEVSQEAMDQKLFRPYIAPAQEDDPRLFLRVFSHEEPATAFAERQGRSQVCQIDGVELAQLAKSYFLRGAYGFLLNDGSVWTALSFPDFLIDFYQEVLGDPSLARPEFVALVQFINMVRQNYAYHIQAGRLTVQNAEKPLIIRFADRPNDLWTEDPGEWVYEDCKIEHLLRASKEANGVIIHIKTTKVELKVQPAYLRAALCAAGLDGQTAQPDLDFHTDAIALDYRMQDFDLERFHLHEQLAELPKPDEPDTETVEPDKDEKPPKGKGQLIVKLTGILSAISMIFHKKEDASGKEKPADDGSDGQAPAAKLTKEGEKKKLKLEPKRMVRGFALAAFLIVAIAFISTLLKPVPRDQLEKALTVGDHEQVVEYYNDCTGRDPGSREELLQLLATALDDGLAAYAADEIPATELAEMISTYSAISAMEDKCTAVYNQASSLEKSKTAYQKGLLETSIVARLQAWQNVIQEDTGSTAAMKAALSENKDAYKELVFQESEDMGTASAIAALTLLQSYYPGDKEVTDAILVRKLEDSRPSQEIPSSVDGPLEDPMTEDTWPVAVGELRVKYNSENGSYDLYIPWENISGTEIESICFLVTALDADGHPVISSGYDENGEPVQYSQYLANMPSGTYEAGYQMPDNGFWQSAFTTEQEITQVRLDSVWVQVDGEGRTYTPVSEESEDDNAEKDSNPLSGVLE